MQKRLVIGAARADKIKIRRLIHLHALVALRQLGLQLGQEALVQRVLQRHPVQAESFFVPAVPRFRDQLGEKVGVAPVGGKDFELPAPSDAGVSDVVKFLWIRMQGELIEHAVAALARLRVRIAAHAVDAQPVGLSARPFSASLARSSSTVAGSLSGVRPRFSARLIRS